MSAKPQILLEFVEQGVVRGVLEAYRTSPGHAEIALSLEDGYRGQGHGRRLFEAGLMHLQSGGFRTIELHCLASNTAVLRLVSARGGEIHSHRGETYATLSLATPAGAEPDTAGVGLSGVV